MVEVVDDFLPDEIFSTIENILMGKNFPWYFHDTVLVKSEGAYNFQFVHKFFSHGQVWSGLYSNELVPMMDFINVGAMVRLKANLLTRTESHIEHGHHTDTKQPCKTMIIYINSNNGYTLFEESGEKVQSKRNRAVIFDASQRHTGATCTDQKCRVVLNLNYFPAILGD